jgi:hypothetical protein
VRQVRHAADLSQLADRTEPGPDLQHDPEADDHHGRDLGDDPEQQDADPVEREPDEVGAHQAGDRAGGPQRRDVRERVGRDLREAAGQAAGQVEEHVAHGAQDLLDVVAEDPEVEHVAGQVQRAAVQEHRRQQRQPDRERHRAPAG